MGRGEIGAIVREHASVSPEVGRRSRSPPYSPRSNWPVRALTSSDNLSARPDFARTRFFCERGDRIVQRQSRRSVARTLYTFSVVDISAAGAACAAPPVKGKNWGRSAVRSARQTLVLSARGEALRWSPSLCRQPLVCAVVSSYKRSALRWIYFRSERCADSPPYRAGEAGPQRSTRRGRRLDDGEVRQVGGGGPLPPLCAQASNEENERKSD
jgi:hypothetical protein